MSLPSNLEAEQSVLAGILLANDNYHEAAALLTDEDFTDPRSRMIWQAMTSLVERRTALDPVTLEAELGQNARMVGGMEAIGRLADRYVSSRHVAAYARILAQVGRRRRLVQTCRLLAEEGGERVEDEDAFLEDAETRLLAAAERKTERGYVLMRSAVGQTVQAMSERARNHGQVVGIPTGIRALDQMIGGLQSGKLYVVAGRPGHGKSALAGNFATSAGCEHGHPVLEFNLEMDVEDVTERRLLSVARTMPHEHGFRARVDQGMLTPRDWETMTAASDRVLQAPIGVQDQAQITAAEICAQARRWSRGRDCGNDRLGLITIDYLQLIDPGARRRNDNREQEVARASRAFKLLAKELRCPVVLLCQLNRKVDDRDNHRPRISDLRESGAIEQDADVVLFVYREGQYIAEKDTDDYRAVEYKAEVIVAKQRKGKTGICNTEYDGEYYRFGDYSERD